MKGLTHMAGGAMAAALTTSVFFPAASPLSVAAALTAGVVGGLVPDVDHPKSTINHELKVTGKIVSFFFSHRGFFHTPFLYLLLGMLVYLGHPMGIVRLISVAFFAGITSHLLLDCLNPTGIPVLYPLSKKKYSLLKIHTGGMGDSLVCACCLALTMYLLVF